MKEKAVKNLKNYVILTAAAAATGLPAEFFEDLPGKEIRKIKTAVTRFFYEDE